MEAHGAGKVSGVNEAEGSEPSIEIKIKTLDSQTYTLRVDKQMPVPALKEQIATVTGVLSEQQRLICRGKVLKDDQLLSAYHVEDGHTLHLVVRQPIPPSESFANHPGTDPAPSASRGRMGPSVVIETFSMPDQGDGIPPEIGRIVSAVLGSFGFPNIGGGVEGLDATRDRGMQTEQATNRGGSDHSNSAFGLPTAVPFGPMHPHVMTDSLTTMSQYLSHMRREFNAPVTGGSRDGAASGTMDSGTTRQSGSAHESIPTPASLAEVLHSSRQFLIEDVAEGLVQLGRQLESQANDTDPTSRSNIQSNALRTGFQLYNLGALLLELGRTTMTVRLGQAPSEAVVNAGPAVFINSSGPNPLMVQPIPFQWGTSVGTAPVGLGQTGSSSGSVIGSGFLPRRIDIQIRRGPPTVITNDNQSEHGEAQQPEHGDTQQPSGQRQATAGSGSANHGSQMSSRLSDGSSLSGDSSVRLVPVRTMVAALPATFGRLPLDSSGNSMGLYYPFFGRFQNPASGNANGAQPSQPSSEHPVGGQTEQQPRPELEPQLQNIEQRIRDVIGRLRDIASGPGGSDQGPHVTVEHRTTGAQTEQQSAAEAAAAAQIRGSIPTSNSRQEDSSGTGSININVVSAGMSQNDQESGERDPANMFFRFLGNLFSEGEAQGEDIGAEPAINVGGVPETSEPSARQMDAEPSATDEGLFLSNILHQVMPMITEHISAGPANMTQGEALTSVRRRSQDSFTQTENPEVGTSRRADTDSDKPNSKRQKME